MAGAPVNISAHTEGKVGTLRLEGRFTFESHQPFRGASAPLLTAEGLERIELDLSGITYMDSSSLGMLLLLREKAEAKGMKVILLRPSPTVLGILKVVHFSRLFEIVE